MRRFIFLYILLAALFFTLFTGSTKYTIWSNYGFIKMSPDSQLIIAADMISDSSIYTIGTTGQPMPYVYTTKMLVFDTLHFGSGGLSWIISATSDSILRLSAAKYVQLLSKVLASDTFLHNGVYINYGAVDSTVIKSTDIKTDSLTLGNIDIGNGLYINTKSTPDSLFSIYMYKQASGFDVLTCDTLHNCNWHDANFTTVNRIETDTIKATALTEKTFFAPSEHITGGTVTSTKVTLDTINRTYFNATPLWKQYGTPFILDSMKIYYTIVAGDTIDSITLEEMGYGSGAYTIKWTYTTDIAVSTGGIDGSVVLKDSSFTLTDHTYRLDIADKGSGGNGIFSYIEYMHQ